LTTVTLASRSAARRALLSAAGVSFDVVESGVDEEALKAGLVAQGADPAALAAALAEEKAVTVSRDRPGLVVGADQTLDLEGALVDKARSLPEARLRLLSLRGRTHALHSAVAVAEGGRVVWRDRDTATLTVRAFSETFLDRYLETCGEALLGSVGCYQLEGAGVQLFERVEGDYFTILGLPLPPLLSYLRERGALPT
jgi:septum formation protein